MPAGIGAAQQALADRVAHALGRAMQRDRLDDRALILGHVVLALGGERPAADALEIRGRLLARAGHEQRRLRIADLQQRVGLDARREQRRPHRQRERIDALADRVDTLGLHRSEREHDELELGLIRDRAIHARPQRGHRRGELRVRGRRAARGDERVDRLVERAVVVVRARGLADRDGVLAARRDARQRPDHGRHEDSGTAHHRDSEPGSKADAAMHAASAASCTPGPSATARPLAQPGASTGSLDTRRPTR